MWVKWGPICAEERDSLQLTCPVRITAPDCCSAKDGTKISIRVFNHQTWGTNTEQWGSCAVHALPFRNAPPFQSIPLQNQAVCVLVFSLLTMNSSLENWEKNRYFALYFTLCWNDICLNVCIPLSPFGKHCSGSHYLFVCLNDLPFNKYIFF